MGGVWLRTASSPDSFVHEPLSLARRPTPVHSPRSQCGKTRHLYFSVHLVDYQQITKAILRRPNCNCTFQTCDVYGWCDYLRGLGFLSISNEIIVPILECLFTIGYMEKSYNGYEDPVYEIKPITYELLKNQCVKI